MIMSLDHQLYNILCEYIYGNMCITLQICDDFLTRGNKAGWPQEVWAYVVRVLVMRDLLRLALSTLGEVPVLGTGGSVASTWNTRHYVMTGGGQNRGTVMVRRMTGEMLCQEKGWRIKSCLAVDREKVRLSVGRVPTRQCLCRCNM